MKKNLKLFAIICAFTICLSLAACSKKDDQKLVIGASPSPHGEILEFIKPLLQEKGVELEITSFTDFILPNNALQSGDIDVNFFQHKPFLDDFNLKNKAELVSVAAIHFEPFGIYKGKSDDLNNIKNGAQIAVPNDTTNEARALLLLEKMGLIKIKPNAGLEATVKDITENKYNIKIVEMEAAQLPRALPDVDFAVINGNYAIPAGITDKLIANEDKNSKAAEEFANIIAVKKGNENNEKIKILIETLKTDEVKKFINEKYGNYVIPVF